MNRQMVSGPKKMKPPLLPNAASCEICGQNDPVVLGQYQLGRGRDRANVVLCLSHGAPVEAGVRGPSGEVHRPTKSELFEFWAERRPGIIWMSPERRILRDRRDRARFVQPERRRILR
jgi:hypothetical protein